MLHLLDKHYARIGSFRTYGEVVEFIHNSQIYHVNSIKTRDHPLISSLELKEVRWRFAYYRHEELDIIYSSMKEPPIKGIELQAFEQGLDLIEIHYGIPLNPIQLLVRSGLDIESLMREWCEAYCNSQGYSLIEIVTLNIEDVSGSPKTGGADDLVV